MPSCLLICRYRPAGLISPHNNNLKNIDIYISLHELQFSNQSPQRLFLLLMLLIYLPERVSSAVIFPLLNMSRPLLAAKRMRLQPFVKVTKEIWQIVLIKLNLTRGVKGEWNFVCFFFFIFFNSCYGPC